MSPPAISYGETDDQLIFEFPSGERFEFQEDDPIAIGVVIRLGARAEQNMAKELVWNLMLDELRAGGGSGTGNYLINVRLHIDQNMQLVVNSSNTIGDVKAMIQKKKGFKASRLMIGKWNNCFEHKLKTASTLSDYNIQANDWLGTTEVEIAGADEATYAGVIAYYESADDDVRFQIQVKTLTSRTITLNEVSKHNTISDLKAMIQEKAKLPIASHRLTFESKPLSDDNTLASYDIVAGSTVVLTFVLQGAGKKMNADEDRDPTAASSDGGKSGGKGGAGYQDYLP
jgi:hypothetical protein